MKELAEDDPAKVPGYATLSPEAQEQVRLAFEDGVIADKEFKGIRTEFIKKGGSTTGAKEITNAESYFVDVAKRASMCRSGGCMAAGTKITKGEMRLGIVVDFDGDHSTTYFKHW